MNIFLSQAIVRDLGWTLVHFLWEGLAIAALLAAVLRQLKNNAAHVKYLAGCTALALMALAPPVTLALVAQQSQRPAISSARTNSGWIETSARNFSTPLLVVKAEPDAPAASFSKEPELLFPWLVLGWIAGVCALSGRLFVGWLQVRRLRLNSTNPLPWTRPFVAIAQRLRVSRPVRLLQSAWVEVPTVIGWLRPAILLPASCVIGLTPRQLESIIAHELAHIRRHDYLINLLQSAVETLLFYHPAVWWVSRRIRDEREHCCDDLAVAVCGDRVGYARALATLEELRPASAQLVLAAAGAPLLQRIRRLAGQPDRSAGRASWPIAGIALLLVLGILAAGMREHRAVAQQSDGQLASPVQESRSSPKIFTLAQTPDKSSEPPPLEIRTFHVDSSVFIPRLESAVGIPAGTGGNDVESANYRSAVVVKAVLEYFARAGLDLSTNPGRVVIFNDRKSTLTVRATAAELVMIEKEVSILDDARSVVPRVPAMTGSTIGANVADSPADPLSEVNIKAKFVEFTASPGDTNAGLELISSSRTVATKSFTGLLTEPQFQATIHALEQNNSANILASPEVTTESGRQAQIQIGGVDPILLPPNASSATNTTNKFFGTTLDVIATVADDKKSISMRVIPSISEFLGYKPVNVTNAYGTVFTTIMPRFSLRQTTANVKAWDGLTVVIGGLATDSTNAAGQSVKKELLIFVTANIINPDGTLYNSEEERKALWAQPTTTQVPADR